MHHQLTLLTVVATNNCSVFYEFTLRFVNAWSCLTNKYIQFISVLWICRVAKTTSYKIITNARILLYPSVIFPCSVCSCNTVIKCSYVHVVGQHHKQNCIFSKILYPTTNKLMKEQWSVVDNGPILVLLSILNDVVFAKESHTVVEE